MNFLTAQWNYLAMLNYFVPHEVLSPYLPPYTELDTWDGKAMASVVGFLFEDTKVFGVGWPYHRNFEEVNLRFYIKHFDGTKWRRGVAFVSEIVPRPLIAGIANSLYNEHYSAMPMKHSLETSPAGIAVSYEWKPKIAPVWNSLWVKSGAVLCPIKTGSQEEFIFEHYFGYNALSGKVTIEYAIAHPRWEVYDVLDFGLECDIAKLYGADFAPYIKGKPASVYFARGSAVTVKLPRRISTAAFLTAGVNHFAVNQPG